MTMAASISVSKTFTLNNGHSIPAVGLGTSRIKKDEMENVIKTALDVGYRHFDSAYMYSNNVVLGRVLSDVFSSEEIKRDELFITSKYTVHGIRPADVMKCMKECLENLKLDYVDLFLIHQPVEFMAKEEDSDSVEKHLYLDPTTDYLGIWKEMEKLVSSGLTKSIGVSNFNQQQLTEILQICKIKPAIIQTECHPYLQENELLQFCKENDIIMEDLGALGSTNIDKDTSGFDFNQNETIRDIAKRHDRSIVQTLLRYQLQRGVVVLPIISNAGRLKENINVFEFSLTPSEMSDLSYLDI